MLARMILLLILGMFVLPACQQDEPPPTTEGARQDDAEDAVLSSLREKAEQGDAYAQFNLGIMYAKGQGVPQDDKEAVRWVRAAAEQGNADAQFNLGIMYAEGQGVPQDDKEAVRWVRAAAEQGNTDAQFNLELRDIANRFGFDQISTNQLTGRSVLSITNGPEGAPYSFPVQPGETPEELLQRLLNDRTTQNFLQSRPAPTAAP